MESKQNKTLIPLAWTIGISTVHISITEITHWLVVIHSKKNQVMESMQNKTQTLISLAWTIGISTIHISITETTQNLYYVHVELIIY